MPSMLGMGLKLMYYSFRGIDLTAKAVLKKVPDSVTVDQIVKAERNTHEVYTMSGQKVEYVIVNGHRYITHIFQNGHEIWNYYGLDEIGRRLFDQIVGMIS